jgi:hypothetical protein
MRTAHKEKVRVRTKANLSVAEQLKRDRRIADNGPKKAL